MKPTMSLTQSAVLHFMRDFQQRNGSMPTMVEVAAYFEWRSPNAALEHAQALVSKGYLTRAAGRARGLCFTEQAWIVLRASQPQEFMPNVIALPVVDPSKVSRASREHLGSTA